MASPTKSDITPYRNPRYTNYVLLMLTLVYAFNFIDRQLITILQESIKSDLALSDTQLGLLTGFAFAVFYVTAGIPIARWSDRSNRRNIIALSVGVWSFMTAISGACMNYTQMLLARIGVGVGESGGTPPAHSMISDMYPREKRGTAMSIYSVGINIGIMFGFFLGGILNETLGWRWAFVLVGVPGILLAFIIKMTIAEPLRGWSDDADISAENIPFKQVIRELINNPVSRQIMLGASIFAIAGYGAINWLAPFYIRMHGVSTSDLGLWLSLSIGLFGGIGTFASGLLADHLGKTNKGWYLWIPATAAVIIVPLYIVVLSTDNRSVSLWLNFLPSIFIATYIGPSVAVLHSSIPARMRATASAIYYFMLNIIGLGLGPTLIGIVSDYLAPTQGVESIRWAMLSVIPLAATWSAVHLYLGGRHLSQQD